MKSKAATCRRTPKALALLLIALIAPAVATAAEPIDFTRDVQPILAKHCHHCHGAETQESGFRLDVRASAMKGGDLGEVAIAPGDSAASALVQVVSGAREELVMPPDGERLADTEIETLKRWIDEGAVWPEGEVAAAEVSNHWAFQPLVASSPRVEGAWIENPIDAFLLAKLESAGLSPSPEAPREMLIRRLSLDLLGLPPTLEEIADFLADDSPTAYEKLVERMLASPRFGERAARHWLDVARFAETNGFETNTPRPSAFHYRDWVIDAFNRDLPYDQFVFAQLAGDTLKEDAATGFLVGGAMDEVKSPDPNLTAMQRQNELADMAGTTGMAFLGLTVACARCHNHKFDPISQREYYALTAVFSGVKHGQRPLRSPWQEAAEARLAEDRQRLEAVRGRLAEIEAEADRSPGQVALRAPVDPRRNVERIAGATATQLRFSIEATNDGSEPCLDELELFGSADGVAMNVNLTRSLPHKLASAGDYPGNEKHQLAHLTDGQFGNSRSWISAEPGRGWVSIEFEHPVRIERIEWARDREGVFKDRLATNYAIEVADDSGEWRFIVGSANRLPVESTAEVVAEERLKRLPETHREEFEKLLAREAELAAAIVAYEAQATLAYSGVFDTPPETFRLFRGEPLAPREAVSAGALAFGGDEAAGSLGLSDGAPEAARRAALAEWIVGPAAPLAARVKANRVWQSHFGVGLVATPSDFGKNGSAPSHSDLLDWLAGELISSGWSLKSLHRTIVLSSAYRQTSTPSEESLDRGLAIDADNRLLWRFAPRRIEAEAVRDSVLAASGALDLAMHGPGYSVFEPNENYVRVYEPKAKFTRAEWRRMVYMFKVRMEQDAIFGAFDCPDAGLPSPRRGASITALQAMNLFNSEFLIEQSALLAERVSEEAGADPAAQIERAFAIVFGRAPDVEERAAALAIAQAHGMSAVCRALFNANEFVFMP